MPGSWGNSVGVGGQGPTDLPKQLGHDLDLLAAGEQVAEGHTSDTCHLHRVDEHHEPLKQPQWQEGVLEAVHSQAATRLLIPVLVVGAGGEGLASEWPREGESLTV